jgi:hypothetical protein
VDLVLQQEVAEAGLRLRKAISRVVNETPECLARKSGRWSVEFRSPVSGESIVVTYSGPTMPVNPMRQN